MAARALEMQGYLRPSGGYTLPPLAVTPGSGDAAINWAFSVFYVTTSAFAVVPMYMPYPLIQEQSSTPSTPSSSQAILFVDNAGHFKVLGDNGEFQAMVLRNQGLLPGVFVDDIGAPGWIEGVHVNGSDASPTKILAGDRLLRLGAGGYDAGPTLRLSRATIDFEALSDWNGTSDTGTQIVLRTCADDSGTITQGLLQKGDGHLYDRDNRRLIGRIGSTLFSPSGIYLESIPRWAVEAFSGMVTGQVQYQLIQFEAGDVISNLSWRSIGAAASLTHQISGVHDLNGNRLVQSSDAGSAAWGANTTKTFAMSSPYTVPSTGPLWCDLRVSAGTMPTMGGTNPNTTFQSAAFAEAFHDSNTDTAATTVPSTVGTKTGDAPLWVGIS